MVSFRKGVLKCTNWIKDMYYNGVVFSVRTGGCITSEFFYHYNFATSIKNQH